MRFMVVEEYVAGPAAVYRRAAAQGRMLPDGLDYVDSWVSEGPDGSVRCFQLMETDDRGLLDVWMDRWADLTSLEVHDLMTSQEAASRYSGR